MNQKDISDYVETINEASTQLSEMFVCSAEHLPPLLVAKQRLERWLILMALRKTNHDVTEASKLLETTPQVIYKIVDDMCSRSFVFCLTFYALDRII